MISTKVSCLIFIIGEVIVDELLKKGVRNICVAESSKLRVDDVLDRFADKVSTVRQKSEIHNSQNN